MQKIVSLFSLFCSFYLIFPQACPGAEDFSSEQSSSQAPHKKSLSKQLDLRELYKQYSNTVVRVKYRQGDDFQITSGFFVSENGHILTSVTGGSDFSVETASGQCFSADKMGEDAITAICLLKANNGNTPVPFFSLMQREHWPVIGQELVSLSCKFGLNIAPQKGYITGFNHRCFNDEWPMTLVRSTLKMDGGDCGGAVIDTKGQLQGMLLHAIESANESFFMPLCGLCKIFQDLLVFGRVRYCYVGLNTQAVFDNKRNELHLQVLKVNPASPADKAGFKEGDILMKLNGNEVDSVESFKNFMFLSSPNDPCTVEVLRNDKTSVLTFYLGERM